MHYWSYATQQFKTANLLFLPVAIFFTVFLIYLTALGWHTGLFTFFLILALICWAFTPKRIIIEKDGILVQTFYLLPPIADLRTERFFSFGGIKKIRIAFHWVYLRSDEIPTVWAGAIFFILHIKKFKMVLENFAPQAVQKHASDKLEVR